MWNRYKTVLTRARSEFTQQTISIRVDEQKLFIIGFYISSRVIIEVFGVCIINLYLITVLKTNKKNFAINFQFINSEITFMQEKYKFYISENFPP